MESEKEEGEGGEPDKSAGRHFRENMTQTQTKKGKITSLSLTAAQQTENGIWVKSHQHGGETLSDRAIESRVAIMIGESGGREGADRDRGLRQREIQIY